MQRGSYAMEGAKRRHKRKVVIVVAVIVAAAIAAACVGVFAYFKSTNAKLGLDSSNAAEALVPAKEGEPYYMLCYADLRDRIYAASPESDYAYMLVRVDEDGRAATFLTIPSQLRMRFSDDETHTLAEYPSTLGEAGAIQAISGLVGVDISHFVKTDAQRMAAMVDLVGGVQMDVAEEIDDPKAGARVLHPGQQKLNGSDALVFLRATNVPGGFSKTASNRVAFTMQLLSQALDSSGLGFASLVSDASEYIDTDLSAQDLLSLGDRMRPIDTMTVYECMVPCTTSAATQGEGTAYTVISSQLKSLMDVVGAGEDPTKAERQIGDFSTSEVKVEVRNGAGIDGAAAAMAEKLKALGYQVTDVGNVEDATIYPETLIVYTSPQFEDAALAIVRDTSNGRVVNGGDFYTSEADVIAIIGTNWTG